MAAETRKLEAMARDRDRAGEEAAHQAQRATAAEARCSQMGKEAAEGALQRRRLEDTLRSSTLNEKVCSHCVHMCFVDFTCTTNCYRSWIELIPSGAPLCNKLQRRWIFMHQLES